MHSYGGEFWHYFRSPLPPFTLLLHNVDVELELRDQPRSLFLVGVQLRQDTPVPRYLIHQPIKSKNYHQVKGLSKKDT